MADDHGTLIRAALDRLVSASFQQRAALAATIGLQRTDLVALDHLGGREGVTPTRLAQVLFLSSGGAAAVIDRLVAAGLVSRAHDAGSRRRVLLRVTAHGRAILDAQQAQLIADIAELTAELAPEQRERVERYLTRLADIAERHAERLGAAAAAAAAATSGVPSPVLWG